MQIHDEDHSNMEVSRKKIANEVETAIREAYEAGYQRATDDQMQLNGVRQVIGAAGWHALELNALRFMQRVGTTTERIRAEREYEMRRTLHKEAEK